MSHIPRWEEWYDLYQPLSRQILMLKKGRDARGGTGWVDGLDDESGKNVRELIDMRDTSESLVFSLYAWIRKMPDLREPVGKENRKGLQKLHRSELEVMVVDLKDELVKWKNQDIVVRQLEEKIAAQQKQVDASSTSVRGEWDRRFQALETSHKDTIRQLRAQTREAADRASLIEIELEKARAEHVEVCTRYEQLVHSLRSEIASVERVPLETSPSMERQMWSPDDLNILQRRQEALELELKSAREKYDVSEAAGKRTIETLRKEVLELEETNQILKLELKDTHRGDTASTANETVEDASVRALQKELEEVVQSKNAIQDTCFELQRQLDAIDSKHDANSQFTRLRERLFAVERSRDEWQRKAAGDATEVRRLTQEITNLLDSRKMDMEMGYGPLDEKHHKRMTTPEKWLSTIATHVLASKTTRISACVYLLVIHILALIAHAM